MSELIVSIVDVETTGTTPNRICEIGVVQANYLSGETIREYSTLINVPDIVEGKGGTRTHKIELHEVEHAPTFSEIASLLLNMFHDTILVVHNNSTFDECRLKEEFERTGDFSFSEYDGYLNTLRLAQTVNKDHALGMESQGLEYCVNFFDIPKDQSFHSALVDARYTKELLYKLRDYNLEELASLVSHKFKFHDRNEDKRPLMARTLPRVPDNEINGDSIIDQLLKIDKEIRNGAGKPDKERKAYFKGLNDGLAKKFADYYIGSLCHALVRDKYIDEHEKEWFEQVVVALGKSYKPWEKKLEKFRKRCLVRRKPLDWQSIHGICFSEVKDFFTLNGESMRENDYYALIKSLNREQGTSIDYIKSKNDEVKVLVVVNVNNPTTKQKEAFIEGDIVIDVQEFQTYLNDSVVLEPINPSDVVQPFARKKSVEVEGLNEEKDATMEKRIEFLESMVSQLVKLNYEMGKVLIRELPDFAKEVLGEFEDITFSEEN